MLLTARTAAWFASVMGVGLLLLALSGIGLLRPVEDVSLRRPLARSRRCCAPSPSRSPTSSPTTATCATSRSENERLRAENERLNAEIARLREEAHRSARSWSACSRSRTASPNQEFVAASVVARDPSNLRQVVAIDRGRTDGIKVGMPVVTEGNTLVGTSPRSKTTTPG